MFLTVSCFVFVTFFFFKQKTAYEMRISDWSSDVCSSDLLVFDEGAWMNRLIRLIAICFGSLILWTSPLQAQERSAVRAGFELPANSGKKILIFRPRISVGSQSTGVLLETNAERPDLANLNMPSSLAAPQKSTRKQAAQAPP